MIWPSETGSCITALFDVQGRVCVATRAFKPGDVLFEDSAFVHASELPQRYHAPLQTTYIYYIYVLHDIRRLSIGLYPQVTL